MASGHALVIKRGIARRYAVLYGILVFLPFVLVGGALLHSVHTKLEERLVNLLQTGRQLAQSTVVQDEEKLLLIADHAAFLTLPSLIENVPPDALKLQGALERLAQAQNLDWGFCLSKDHRWLATHQISPVSLSPQLHPKAKALDELVDRAQHGVGQSGLLSVRPDSTHPAALYYVAAVPIYSERASSTNQPKHIIGTLVIGQTLHQHLSYGHLASFIPSLNLRLFDIQSSSPKLLFSTFKTSLPPESQPLRSAFGHLKANPDQSWLFKESYPTLPLESLAVTLKDMEHTPAAMLVISTAQSEELSLYREEWQLTFLYLALAFIGLAWLGLSFHRSIIQPINIIAQVADEFASGNRLTRIDPLPGVKHEVKHTIDRFNQMLERLAESESLRDNFISTLTHDLRTPLIAEQRVLETLVSAKQGLPQSVEPMMVQLLHNNEHLLSMVNQLLDLYQFEAGAFTLEVAPLSFHALVDRCFTQLTSLASQHRAVLQNLVTDPSPPLKGDASQWLRVFVNLVSNALENSDEGTEITVSSALNQNYYELRVEDDGPGIDETTLETLFDRYSRGSLTRKKIGTGLGLYICRMIIEHHGGTIAVYSELNVGTCFLIRLPLTAV